MKPLFKIAAFFGLFMLILPPLSIGQVTFPRNGVYDERDGVYAFTNATIQKSWNEKVENATLIVRKGRVEAIGAGLAVPKDATVIDLKGKFIYPSFVDIFSNYGMPETPPTGGGGGFGGGGGRPQQQMLSNKKGAYSWNEALRTEYKAHEVFAQNERDAEALRGIGFGAVLTHRFDGISRGSAALVSLANEKEHSTLLKNQAAHVLSFSKGTSTQMNPQSLMGCIALLRQTYLDGQWYATQTNEERNLSLDAWNQVQALPQIFDVSDKLEVLRAATLGAEFKKKYIIRGRGDEYQRLDNIKSTGSSLILGLNFPETYDVEDPFDAQQVSLSDMKHWELAPTNPAKIAAAGIEFCLTSAGLRNRMDFFKNLRTAIDNGLTEGDALKALTVTPAKLVGAESEIGSLDKGKWANFFITTAPVFSREAKIYQHWVQGKNHVVSADAVKTNEAKGNFSFEMGEKKYQKLDVSSGSEAQIFVNDTTKIKANYNQNANNVNISFTPTGEKDLIRLFGIYDGGKMSGRGQLGDGTWIDWKANPMKADSTKVSSKPNTENPKSEIQNPKPNTPSVKTALGDVIYPFSAYGKKDLPTAQMVLFKNATVWTNETEGILQNADVLITAGKISQIGKDLTASSTTIVVDAAGKHLTAGIIDEHSHIAASRGINEGTQSSTSEVRIGDIINSEDINIYRQLAGGVTSSHILHGSANSIGGQTQLIKLKWGFEPEKLKFPNWPGFIKFALGENVKQSNWDVSNDQRVRFPQSRMGVEQVFEDHFNRAKDYIADRNSGKPYRRDLELEALAEILEGKRHITCHSYVQSEITMLLRVADRYGFKVNTFTHILEGYKVADKMAKHGAAGAGFADWWSYKYEVYEAIPQNAKLMQDVGVLASINSDDAEMARRLNQEAGKSIMYAGMDEEAAWKLVTLNPAKTLRVADRVGSLKVGKDADVVLWSDNPLSIYAKADQTWVDGIKFFDRNENELVKKDVQTERARLIQKMIVAKKGGAPTQAAQARPQRLYDCEDVDDEMKD